ncbi:hypothetical protein Poly30_35330 [Planctomycetes bacterium Poly30]|uniref:Uncharacterized protein n=1 Tax=Saltatorellus ferox TaxID=2528018 RepID=A0A518EV82_9BACT|nr:hypothetical protein Poly30_35330 [Planctomycetes bacterium Poly30]
MLLALEDPLWSRLYSAYGLIDVARILSDLRDRWSVDALKDLYWETLFHQESLYPATYAALPWLLELQPENGCLESALFFSAVLESSAPGFATLTSKEKQSSEFDGLSTAVEDHQHDWLPPPRQLTRADMHILEALEEWFAQARVTMAEICVREAERAPRKAVPHLLRGPVCLLKDSTLSLPSDSSWPDRLRRLQARPRREKDAEGQLTLFAD